MTTFEEYAGAEKLVAWFHAQGFKPSDTAPRIDNDWAVDVFTTEEALSGFPCLLGDPYPTERTFKLAVEIIDAPEVEGIGPSGWWWDAKSWATD